LNEQRNVLVCNTIALPENVCQSSGKMAWNRNSKKGGRICYVEKKLFAYPLLIISMNIP
jgi:hypothetical protein